MDEKKYYKKVAQMAEKKVKYLIPSQDEVIKSRDIGRATTPMTRLQKIGFAAMLKNAYEQLLENPNTVMFRVPTSFLLRDMGINHKNIFSLFNNEEKRNELIHKKRAAGDFSNIITLDDIPPTEKRLQDHLVDLQQRSIQFKHKNSKGKMTFTSNVLLPFFSLDENFVVFEFTSFVRERILCQGNAYIADMSIMSSLSSSYAVTLYELILQRNRSDIDGTQFWVCDSDDLKEYLGGEELKLKPMRTSNFNTTILDKAIKEINSKTNFNLISKNVKDGKNIIAYRFEWERISRKKEAKNQQKKATNGSPLSDETSKDSSPAGMQEYIEYVRENALMILLDKGNDTKEEYSIKDKKFLTKKKRILKKEESLAVWIWMYEHQDKVFFYDRAAEHIVAENLFDFYEKL